MKIMLIINKNIGLIEDKEHEIYGKVYRVVELYHVDELKMYGKYGGLIDENTKEKMISNITKNERIIIDENSFVINSDIRGDTTIISSNIANSSIYDSKIESSNVCNSNIFGLTKVIKSTLSRCDLAEKSMIDKVHISDIYAENIKITSIDDYIFLRGFGSRGIDRVTLFFIDTNDNIRVNCGCFKGSVKEFKEQVVKTHGDSDIGKEYLNMTNICVNRLRRTHPLIKGGNINE